MFGATNSGWVVGMFVAANGLGVGDGAANGRFCFPKTTGGTGAVVVVAVIGGFGVAKSNIGRAGCGLLLGATNSGWVVGKFVAANGLGVGVGVAKIDLGGINGLFLVVVVGGAAVKLGLAKGFGAVTTGCCWVTSQFAGNRGGFEVRLFVGAEGAAGGVGGGQLNVTGLVVVVVAVEGAPCGAGEGVGGHWNVGGVIVWPCTPPVTKGLGVALLNSVDDWNRLVIVFLLE